VSAEGYELTSVYQQRYRATLLRRGQWTPLSAAPDSGLVDIIVWPARRASEAPPGYMPFFLDRRFAAYLRR